jgi:hypothetical protein
MFWLYVLAGISVLLVILWRFDRRGTGRKGSSWGIDRRARRAESDTGPKQFFKGGGL